MSLLPQSKKSPEEIAKLRESLGIVGPPPVEEVLPAAAPVQKSLPEVPLEIAREITKTEEPAPAPPIDPPPAAEVHEPKPVRSLKRSERIPQLPVSDDSAADPIPPASKAVSTPLPVSHLPKTMRSLRKSEQGPIAPLPAPSPDSKLPVHRRSEQEILEMRRREMLAPQTAAGHLQSLAAHPALIVPGYLFAIAAAVGIYFYDLDKEITGSCVAVALIIAGIIFFKKPLSVHHAAFITVAALFVVVFGALYYFPQLSYGAFPHPSEEKSGTHEVH